MPCAGTWTGIAGLESLPNTYAELIWWTMLRKIMLIFVLSLPIAAAEPIPTDSYQVLRVYPHDPNAFTQGLLYADGHLYESTGLNGRSSIRMVELSTGRLLKQFDLLPEYFGE